MGVLPVPSPSRSCSHPAAVAGIPHRARAARAAAQPGRTTARRQAGDDRPVLLIPGFMAGDGSLGDDDPLAARNGYRTRRPACASTWLLGGGVRAAGEAARGPRRARPGSRVDDHRPEPRRDVRARSPCAARTSSRASSRSAAPTLRSCAVHPLVLAQVGVVGALGTLRVPGLFDRCLRGDCCERFRAALAARSPRTCATRRCTRAADGIVDWRTCLDPEADEHVEIRASHCGMGVSTPVYSAIADALTRVRGRDGAWRQARRSRCVSRGRSPTSVEPD